ncbi:MAG: prepilin-type N-terminal cleavage/methylation domain-containing protein [Methylococcales bacterium]|jgi:type IV fimbrial biogenesis protein FimT|nr:prepilin-type N-terminal cleavage/methylation domain-containing protein [Methylococcales bacterium]MBT7409341.1 prepilin-type N-terminal cleavage/methylation domain-containing protein [Methylococcales bacterium]
MNNKSILSLRNNLKQSGFSLIEIMLVIAIFTIIFGVAVPSMSSLAKNNRLATTADSLFALLSFAKNEAVFQSSLMTICKSDSPMLKKATCTAKKAKNVDWSSGWILINELNKIIRVHEPVDSSIEIRSDWRVEFMASGLIKDKKLSIIFCDDREKEKGYTIVLKKGELVKETFQCK